jgi:hypothetical protein
VDGALVALQKERQFPIGAVTADRDLRSVGLDHRIDRQFGKRQGVSSIGDGIERMP